MDEPTGPQKRKNPFRANPIIPEWPSHNAPAADHDDPMSGGWKQVYHANGVSTDFNGFASMKSEKYHNTIILEHIQPSDVKDNTFSGLLARYLALGMFEHTARKVAHESADRVSCGGSPLGNREIFMSLRSDKDYMKQMYDHRHEVTA